MKCNIIKKYGNRKSNPIDSNLISSIYRLIRSTQWRSGRALIKCARFSRSNPATDKAFV